MSSELIRLNTQRRGHELLPDDLAALLPPLYHFQQPDLSLWDALPPVHFFAGGWDWYPVELDYTQGLFFGLVSGHEVELGYFSLYELETTTYTQRVAHLVVPMPIERDLYWTPAPLSALRDQHQGRCHVG